jgi:hypothetical protein
MKLTFRTRLYAGFALVIAVFLCVIGITVTKIEHARADVSAIREEAQKLQLANQWLANIRQNSARSLAVARSPGQRHVGVFQRRRWQPSVTVDTTKTQKAFLGGCHTARSQSAGWQGGRSSHGVAGSSGRHQQTQGRGRRCRCCANGGQPIGAADRAVHCRHAGLGQWAIDRGRSAENPRGRRIRTALQVDRSDDTCWRSWRPFSCPGALAVLW